MTHAIPRVLVPVVGGLAYKVPDEVVVDVVAAAHPIVEVDLCVYIGIDSGQPGPPN